MEHTKGEWIYGKNGSSFNVKAYTGHHLGNLCPNIYGENIEQAEANAKLIAAAPELLDALIELVNSINPQDVNSNKTFMGLNLGKDYVGGASIPSGKSIHKAINAINKATK